MRDPELADSIIKALRDDLKETEKRAEMLTLALDQVWDMLARAMSVIDDLTNLRLPCSRTQQEIDDLIEGIAELEGPQE